MGAGRRRRTCGAAPHGGLGDLRIPMLKPPPATQNAPEWRSCAANRTVFMPRRMPLIAAFVLAGALSAAAQPAADTQDNLQPQKRDAIGCDGAFARDTSHAKLVTAFGAKN